MSSIKSVLLISVLMVLASCASLPTDYERQASYALENTSDTHQGRVISPFVKAHPGESGMYLLNDSMDAFVARFKIIEQAERSLDVQYYIWHDDIIGKVLFDRLLVAANRGVRVRLLLDDMDTAGKEANLAILDSHPNIEIRLYNPFANRNNRFLDFVTNLKRINRRMHNKSLTADNQLSIVGGRNIGVEYFAATEDSAEFVDLDVLVAGPVVKDISNAFDLYWNSEYVIPVSAFATEETVSEEQLAVLTEELSEVMKKGRQTAYAQAVRESDLAKKLDAKEYLDFTWGKAVLIYDLPSKVVATDVQAGTHMAVDIKKELDAVQKELIIISPYFVPAGDFVPYLASLVKKGIKVTVLTNSLAGNDVTLVFSGYKGYRWDLVKAGINLYEFKPVLSREKIKEKKKKKKNRQWAGASQASLHAKALIFDREKLFVGSFNLDPRSVKLNTEMGLVLESKKYATLVGKVLDDKLSTDAYQLRLQEIPTDDEFSFSPTYALKWAIMEEGKEVIYNKEPDTSWWQRFVAGFMTLFAIESML